MNMLPLDHHLTVELLDARREWAAAQLAAQRGSSLPNRLDTAQERLNRAEEHLRRQVGLREG